MVAKVRSIKESPAPKDKQWLRPYLGLFKIPSKPVNKGHTLALPLEKGKRWQQTKAHQNAIDSVKELLTSSKVLTPTVERKLSWHVMRLLMEPEQSWLIQFQMAVNTQWHLCHEH